MYRMSFFLDGFSCGCFEKLKRDRGFAPDERMAHLRIVLTSVHATLFLYHKFKILLIFRFDAHLTYHRKLIIRYVLNVASTGCPYVRLTIDLIFQLSHPATPLPRLQLDRCYFTRISVLTPKIDKKS